MKTIQRTGLASLLIASALAACSTPSDSAGGAQASIQDSCINPTQIREQKILSDQEIQFTLKNGEVWLNTLPRVCSNLKFQGGFTWDVRGMQVCSNQQTIYVKDHGTPCQLGAFGRVSTGS